jgi:hypothetical protein
MSIEKRYSSGDPERALRRREAREERQRADRQRRPRGEASPQRNRGLRTWRAPDAAGDPSLSGTDVPRRRQPGQRARDSARERAEKAFRAAAGGDDGAEG